MAISRKDPKGRKLREGENWRNDGRYSYRYTDVRTGKRLTVYAQDLPKLREKEKQIAKDMEDNILTDGAIKKMTLNTLFERYMATRELADTTRVSYVRAWENRVKDEIGNIKVVQLLPSHIKAYYAKLSKAELLPKFSAHVMRHTACTRMAECRMDVKVLQYIMGHAHIDVTMEVYNHIGELTRIEKEIARLDSMALNA